MSSTTASQANQNNTKVRDIAVTALMTAIMCILGPLSIPIGPVPISLTVFTVWLAVAILGTKRGTVAYIIYLLIGLVGVPVLSGFTAGPGKLFGPTGGYLLGFIPMAIVSGLFIDHFWNKVWLQLVGMAIGLVICYFLGTVMLAALMKMDFRAAFAAGVVPFVIFDIIKMVVSLFLGRTIRPRIQKIHS